MRQHVIGAHVFIPASLSCFYKCFSYFILFSPYLSLEGITPIFVDEGTEAQTSLMPVQGFK